MRGGLRAGLPTDPGLRESDIVLKKGIIDMQKVAIYPERAADENDKVTIIVEGAEPRSGDIVCGGVHLTIEENGAGGFAPHNDGNSSGRGRFDFHGGLRNGTGKAKSCKNLHGRRRPHRPF